MENILCYPCILSDTLQRDTLFLFLLLENPIAEEDDYRLEVLIALRKIIRLDKDEYMEEEREEADALYEQRQQEELASQVKTTKLWQCTIETAHTIEQI